MGDVLYIVSPRVINKHVTIKMTSWLTYSASNANTLNRLQLDLKLEKLIKEPHFTTNFSGESCGCFA